MGRRLRRPWGRVRDVSLGAKQRAPTIEEFDEQLAESCAYGHNLSWLEVHPNVVQAFTRELKNEKCSEIQATM
jgi:hypothetical protein